MNRHYLEDGAYYIDASNKFNAQGLLMAISKQFGLISNDRNEIVNVLRTRKIGIIIENFDQIVSKDQYNLKDMLYFIIEHTEFIKLILLTDQDQEIINGKKHKISTLVKLIKVYPLQKEDGIKLMY